MFSVLMVMFEFSRVTISASEKSVEQTKKLFKRSKALGQQSNGMIKLISHDRISRESKKGK
ncbi:MAG: hypothetical protein ACTSP4_11960 [Candidatus Hodarchaeales archaeon]